MMMTTMIRYKPPTPKSSRSLLEIPAQSVLMASMMRMMSVALLVVTHSTPPA